MRSAFIEQTLGLLLTDAGRKVQPAAQVAKAALKAILRFMVVFQSRANIL